MNGSEKITALEQFLIDNEDFEQLEAELSGFNIFEAIGAVRQELRHSDFLSFLLNPSANHGLGDSILKKILIDITSTNNFDKVSSLDIQLNGFENTEIRREWRNIDLIIVQQDLKLVVAFENKVDSGESSNQLQKYTEILDENYGDKYALLKVFLTPDGVSPVHDMSWGTYSYQRIATQLESYLVKKRGELSPKILQLLQDYLTLLRRHIVPDQRLVELCRKIYREHSSALDLIFEYKMDIYTEIQSHLTELIEKDDELVLDDSNKTFIRFRPKVFDTIKDLSQGDGWTSTKKILLYEFQNRGDSLRLKLIIGPGDSNTREVLYEMCLLNKKDFRNSVSKLSEQWTQIMRLDVLSKNYYDDLDFEVIKNRIDSFWEGFKKKEFQIINKLVKEEF